MFSQYKTIKKAFSDFNRQKSGIIDFEAFLEVVKGWGFDCQENILQDLFNWLDNDKDGKLSFEDLRQTVGKETNPLEQLYFR